MEADTDRNPSPPPGLLHHSAEFLPDRIGDSVFSKHWLFQILISILEAVNKEVSEDVEMQSSDKESSGVMDIHELDPKLEDDACTLWDTSSNIDVAHFLHEFKAVDIFLEVIEKTKSPRLLEISIGILGNMASFNDLCQEMSNNELLLKTIVPLSGSSDAPTIVQVLRLIHAGVVNHAAGPMWLDALRCDSSFMQNMRFILENSLNGDVLKGTLQLLYYILDKEDDVCVEWADKDYAKSVIVAGKQLHDNNDFEALDELWLLLNLMCQHDENVSAIAEFFGELQPIYHAYLMRISEFEYSFLPPMERVAALAASFTTLATLLGRENVDHEIFRNDDTFTKSIKNLYNTITETLDKATILDREDGIADDDATVEHVPENKTRTESQMNKSSVAAASEPNGDDSGSFHRGKLTHTVSLHEDDYNSLYILKESMTELCTISMPSILPSGEDSRSKT